jgi:hypothetical protein
MFFNIFNVLTLKIKKNILIYFQLKNIIYTILSYTYLTVPLSLAQSIFGNGKIFFYYKSFFFMVSKNHCERGYNGVGYCDLLSFLQEYSIIF